MSAIEHELLERILGLSGDERRQLLELARSLSVRRRVSLTPGATLLALAGTLDESDARAMARAVDDGCEAVDDSW